MVSLTLTASQVQEVINWKKPPATPSDLVATITLADGTVLTFNGADAVDQGEFVGEFVRQRSFLTKQGPWKVMFRIDTNAPRDEIVVEYGSMTANSGPVVNIDQPFVFTVSKAGTEVYRYTVSNIFWFSRFRWQSAERPIVRTVDDLVARKWLIPLGQSGLYGRTGLDYELTMPGPMGNISSFRTDVGKAGNYSSMGRNMIWDQDVGAPGEREEIGHDSEPAALCRIFGLDKQPLAWKNCLAGAAWMSNAQTHIRCDDGSMPMVRDLSTFNQDAAVNSSLIKTRVVSIYSNGKRFAALYAKTGNYIDLWNRGATAHWPNWIAFPWMVTEDPYLLEELQMGINWRILDNGVGRVIEQLPGMISITQIRSVAWTLRDLWAVCKSTPDVVPSWLQPKSYFDAVLEDQRQVALRFVHHPMKAFQTFRLWPTVKKAELWMNAWLNAQIGIGVLLGFEQWREVFDWSIQSHIQMCNGKSGWSRQWPIPYLVCLVRLSGRDVLTWETETDVHPSQLSAAYYDPLTYGSWAELWAAYKTGMHHDEIEVPPMGWTFADKQRHTTNPQFGLAFPGGWGWPATADSEASWDGSTLMQQDYIKQTHLSRPSDILFYFTNYMHLRCVLAIATKLGVPEARECYDHVASQLPALYANYPGAGKMYGRACFSVDPE